MRQLQRSLDDPLYGFVHGLAVYLHSSDQLPSKTRVQRFNKGFAVAVTAFVGSMWCAYLFSVIAIASLPAVLTIAFHLNVFPGWLVSTGVIALIAWIAQTFLQLVLLSVIMVGQNVQQAAGDARAAKTFEDTQQIREDITRALDRLDTTTEGGLKEILDALRGGQDVHSD